MDISNRPTLLLKLSILIFIISFGVFLYVVKDKIPLFNTSSQEVKQINAWLDNKNSYVKETRGVKSYSGTVTHIDYLNDPDNLAEVVLTDSQNLNQITLPRYFLANSIYIITNGTKTALSPKELTSKFGLGSSFYIEISYSNDPRQPSFINDLEIYQ